MKKSLAIFIMGFALFLADRSIAEQYGVTAITATGAIPTVPVYDYSLPSSINDQGMVTGMVREYGGQGYTHPYLFQNGELTDLQDPAHFVSANATKISNTDAQGRAWMTINSLAGPTGLNMFIKRSDGSSLTGNYWTISDIDDQGRYISQNPDGDYQALMNADGTVAKILGAGSLAHYPVQPTAMSHRTGVIVGNVHCHDDALLYAPCPNHDNTNKGFFFRAENNDFEIQMLQSPADSRGVFLTAVSENSVAAGHYYPASLNLNYLERPRGILYWANGSFLILPTLPNGENEGYWVTGIALVGSQLKIVGYTSTLGACVWTVKRGPSGVRSTVSLLHDLVPNHGSWYYFRNATAINSLGQIVGSGLRSYVPGEPYGNIPHSYLLTPIGN